MTFRVSIGSRVLTKLGESEVTFISRASEGDPAGEEDREGVQEVEFEKGDSGYVFDLANGRWVYSDQVYEVL